MSKYGANKNLTNNKNNNIVNIVRKLVDLWGFFNDLQWKQNVLLVFIGKYITECVCLQK